MRKCFFAAALIPAMTLMACTPSIMTDPPPTAEASLPSIVRAAEAFYQVELVYNLAAKAVIAGIETGVIPSSSFPTIRDLNAKATDALRAGKLAIDLGDYALLGIHQAALLDTTSRLLKYTVP